MVKRQGFEWKVVIGKYNMRDKNQHSKNIHVVQKKASLATGKTTSIWKCSN